LYDFGTVVPKKHEAINISNESFSFYDVWGIVLSVEVGMICVKLAGREAGKKCVIVDIIDENFALITGPQKVNTVRRRRVNLKHIELTNKIIDVKRGATDEEVIQALSTAGELEKMADTVQPLTEF
jgi:large subunit ribosomal protein L14e